MKYLFGFSLVAFGCVVCLLPNPLMLIWGVPPIFTGLAILLDAVTAAPPQPKIHRVPTLAAVNPNLLRRVK